MTTQTQAPTLAKPAGASPNCDAWLPNPHRQHDPDAPLLHRCPQQATTRLVVMVADDCRAYKRCNNCASVLLQRERMGLVEILMRREA